MKMKSEKLGTLAKNLDNKRKPLNAQQREKIRGNGSYPYIGANKIMDYVDEYLFDEQILCVAEDGGTWGSNEQCAVIYNGKTWVNNHTHVLIENGKSDLRYLRYFLNYASLNQYITGATRGKLTRRTLDSVKIPLPESLDEQIKIAKLLSQVESLIAKREESIKLLDELLKSTFLDMFGDPVLNPKSLKKVRIDSFTNVETGATPNRKKEVVYYMNGTIHWVKTTEVNNSYIEKTEEKITELALSESNCKIFPKNTLLLAMYGQGKTRGKVGFLNIDASTNQACAAILPDKKYSSLFLFYQLQFLYDHIRILGRGGGQPNLNLSIVKKYEVLSPIYKDNVDIKQFEKITQQIEQTKQQYKKSLHELKNLFGSLSQKAFKGELDLSNMEIETFAQDSWTKKVFAKQKAYEKALETKVYESGLEHAKTVSIKKIPLENLENYIIDLIKLDSFDMEEMEHHFGIDFSYDEFKEKFYELLNDGKIKQVFDTELKKMRFEILS